MVRFTFADVEECYLHSGVETLTCIAICGGGMTVLLILGMKPVSKPPGKNSQGVPKLDWVAVWFADMKVKTTRSPTAASIVFGV